jgi:O-antigen/teichoic acid export membrane protein
VLIRHTLAYLPAQLLSPLAQLATAIVLTHALGAADYGLTMLVFASQELVFLVCLSWWTTFFLRYGGRFAGDDATQLAGTESAILLVSSVAQVLVTLLVIVLTEPGVPWPFYVGACLFTVTRSHLGLLSERARREAAIGAYTAVQIGGPLGGLALTLGLMWAARTAQGGGGAATAPAHVLLVFALAQALVGGMVAHRLGLLVRPRALQRGVLRQALAFGAPVVLSNLLSWLGGNGIRFVVHHGAGAVALGWLSVGWGLATRLAGVAAMVVTAAAYPLAVKAMEAGDAAGARRQIADNAVLLLALLALATVAGTLLGRPFVELLVAQQYHATTLAILPWALLGAAVRNLRMHGWDPLYLLCERPRAMVVLDAIEAAATLAAAALGLWWGGVEGAVAGTALAAVVLAAGDAWYLQRHFGLQLHAWASLRVLLAATLLALLLLAAANRTGGLPSSATGLAAAALAACAAYALLLAALFPVLARSSAVSISIMCHHSFQNRGRR